jgi:hypothetical protein
MTAQVLANLLMRRATARAMCAPDPREYWGRVVEELAQLRPLVQHSDEELLCEQLLEFGARLGLIEFSPLEVN